MKVVGEGVGGGKARWCQGTGRSRMLLLQPSIRSLNPFAYFIAMKKHRSAEARQARSCMRPVMARVAITT